MTQKCRSAVSMCMEDGYIRRSDTSTARAHISHVVRGWHRFLNSNDTDEWVFDYEGEGDPDDGYIRRSGNGHDFKHFFHYRPRLWQLLHRHNISLTPECELWLEACDGLYRACEHLLYQTLADIDAELPGLYLEQRAREHGIHVLRLLRYDATSQRGGVIAKPHLDKSLMTIHVADSHPGLRFGDSKQLHCPEGGEVCCFPGKKAELVTAGTLTALEHCVTDEYPGEERWSIVFFGHCDVSAFKQ